MAQNSSNTNAIDTSIDSLSLNDSQPAMSEATQLLPASLNSSVQRLHLLGLPNEIPLAIVARVPFSSKAFNDLANANHQLRDLITDSSSGMELRTKIAETQFPIPNALRLNRGSNHTWITLHEFQMEASKVKAAVDWMLQHSPDPTTAANSDLLGLGLHLFTAISRIRIPVNLEQLAAEFLLALGPSLIAVMRLVSATVRSCYRSHPTFVADSEYQALLNRSSLPLVLEDTLVGQGVAFSRESPDDPNSFWSNPAALNQLKRFWSLSATHFDTIKGFFGAYIMCSPTTEDEQAAYELEISKWVHGRNHMFRGTWASVANDILVLDIWKREAPARDQFGDVHAYHRAFHGFCTGGKDVGDWDVDERMVDHDDEQERLLLRITEGLCRLER